MIHLISLIIFLFYFNHTLAQCTLEGTKCTFTGVNLTSTNLYLAINSNSNVTEVTFVDSSMQKLTYEICEAFPNLEKLHLNDLSLESINENALDECKNLIYLDLSSNKLIKLDNKVFAGNKKLSFLDLSNNALKSWNPIVLQSFNQVLEVLRLSNNKLEKIKFNNFPQMLKVTNLTLDGCDLADFDIKSFEEALPALKSVQLHNNKFGCDHLRIVLAKLDEKGVNYEPEVQNHAMKRDENGTKVKGVDCVPNLDEQKFIRFFESLDLPQKSDLKVISDKIDVLSTWIKDSDDESRSMKTEQEIMNDVIKANITELHEKLTKIEGNLSQTISEMNLAQKSHGERLNVTMMNHDHAKNESNMMNIVTYSLIGTVILLFFIIVLLYIKIRNVSMAKINFDPSVECTSIKYDAGQRFNETPVRFLNFPYEQHVFDDSRY